MTTYVLHGGNTAKDSEENKLFFRQFTSSVLLCYFARNKSEWSQLFERDKAKIDPHVRMSVVHNIADLKAKLPSTNALYVAGGEQEYLEPYIKDLSKLKMLLDGKTYIGSSMGAFLASEHYILSYDRQDSSRIYDGLGFVHVNTLCHWNIENHKEQKIKMLKEKYPEIPILLLNEEEFTTITV